MAANMVAILDAAGYPTGSVCTQDEAHIREVWHAEVRLCATNGLGHILQAQRDQWRGLPVWDLFLVCGDVWANETPTAAVSRMLGEQFGLTLSSDQALGLLDVGMYTFREKNFSHKVYSHMFAMSLSDIDERSLKVHAGVDVRRYPKWQLEEDLERPEYARVFTQHFHREPPAGSRQLYYKVLSQVG